jgi:hypothetical protein
MTVPAHTNTTTTAAAAEVLRKHRLVWYPDGASGCDCEALYSGSHEQHQADMLAAAGLLADPTTRTEWGVRCDDAEGDVIESDDRKDAERIKAFYDAGMDHGHALVRRTVTDWTPVEESSDD